MIPGVTVNAELTDELLATIPPDIVRSMSAQMREVLSIQATRAPQCRKKGFDTADAAGDISPAEHVLLAKRAEYRAERSVWNEGGPVMARTYDRHIQVAGVDVPVRIHRPIAEAALPGLVFLHGGGFTVGDLDTHDRIMRVLAETGGFAVIGVDYSLSPEVKYPQALHECAGIVDRLSTDGDMFSIDGMRLAIAGDSAGASLALGIALLLRDQPGTINADPATFSHLRALVSIYGAHGLNDSASRRLFGGDWDGMGANDLDNIVDDYFSTAEDEQSPFFAHLTADLSGLPPVFVAAAGLDPLRDDSRALAQTLERVGNDVRFEEYAHVLHSFLHFGRILGSTNTVLRNAAAFVAERL